MAWPTVIINILNMMRGPIPGVEFHFLFVVYGTVPGPAPVSDITLTSATTQPM